MSDQAPSSDTLHTATNFGSFCNHGGVISGYIANSSIIGQSHQYHYYGSRQASMEERNKYEALAWLSPLDYSTKQREFRDKVAPHTGGWLINSKEFVKWRGQEIRKLWCIGMPGAGKTILASIIVDHLRELELPSGKPAVACLYLTYKEQPTLEHLLGSVANQLLDPSEELPSSLKKKWDRQRHATDKTQQSPTLENIDDILAEVTQDRHVYVIVDALDECSTDLRKPLIDHLRKISEHVNLLVTSRLLEDLNGMVQGFKCLDIIAHTPDIYAYVNHVIDKHTRLLDMVNKHPNLRDEIKHNVAERSSQMFLLAQLHMDAICAQVTPFRVRKTLEELPKKPEEIYKSTMMRIRGQDKERREYAIQILSWIVYAARPLSVEEILNAIAVEKGDNNFYEDKMLYRDDLQEFCCGLVVIDGHTQTVRLVHYTAQNYFEDNKSQEFPGFHFHIASICATYLCLSPLEQPDGVDRFGSGISPADDLCERPEDLQEPQTVWHSRERHGNKNVTSCYRDSSGMLRQPPGSGGPRRLSFGVKLKYYPFVVYAGQYLGYHFQQISEQSAIEETVKLIRPLLEDKPKRNFYERLLDHLQAYYVPNYLDQDCLEVPWLCNETSESGFYEEPMSAASSHNFDSIDDTPEQQQINPNSRDYEGRSFLHRATSRNDIPTARMLLEQRASPKATDRYGLTAWAANARPENLETLSLLKKYGANSNDQYGEGVNVIYAAAAGGEVRKVRFLLEKGVDPSIKTIYGWAPLHKAAHNGHLECVRLLLQWGAEKSPISDQSTTPLDQARISHQDVIADILVQEGAETAEEVYAKRGGDRPSYYPEDWPTYRYYSDYPTSLGSDYPSSPDSDEDDGASLQCSIPSPSIIVLDERGHIDDDYIDRLDGIAEMFRADFPWSHSEL